MEVELKHYYCAAFIAQLWTEAIGPISGGATELDRSVTLSEAVFSL